MESCQKKIIVVVMIDETLLLPRNVFAAIRATSSSFVTHQTDRVHVFAGKVELVAHCTHEITTRAVSIRSLNAAIAKLILTIQSK